MDLPPVIYLGPYDFVVRQKKKYDLLGELDKENETIIVRTTQGPANLRDTVLHEVLHAILYVAGDSDVHGLAHEDEERLVRIVTPWLLAFMRDNPHVLAYLLETC